MSETEQSASLLSKLRIKNKGSSGNSYIRDVNIK
jgi:hypothetical protein